MCVYRQMVYLGILHYVVFFPNKFEGSFQLNSRLCNAAIWNINFKNVFRNDQINPSRYLDNPLIGNNIGLTVLCTKPLASWFPAVP